MKMWDASSFRSHHVLGSSCCDSGQNAQASYKQNVQATALAQGKEVTICFTRHSDANLKAYKVTFKTDASLHIKFL